MKFFLKTIVFTVPLKKTIITLNQIESVTMVQLEFLNRVIHVYLRRHRSSRLYIQCTLLRLNVRHIYCSKFIMSPSKRWVFKWKRETHYTYPTYSFGTWLQYIRWRMRTNSRLWGRCTTPRFDKEWKRTRPYLAK